MSIVHIIVVCSSPKAKTLSKPEPVQTGIKVCPQGIPVWTGFTVYQIQFKVDLYLGKRNENFGVLDARLDKGDWDPSQPQPSESRC